MRSTLIRMLFLGGGLVMLGIWAATTVFAETIHLKNGRVIEGNVTEMTDGYIKMKSGDSVFKINFSQMARQSRDLFKQDIKVPREEVDRKSAEKSAPGDGNDPVSVVGWTGRQLTSSYYQNQAERNLNEMNRLAFQRAMKVSQAGPSLRQQFEEEMKWKKEARGEIGKLIKAFQTINPPPEFERFHAKVLEFQAAARKSMDAHLLRDMQAYARWCRKGMLSYIEAMEELQLLYKKHSAPAEEVKKIDKLIRAERELLRRGVTMTYVDSGKPVNFSIPAREGEN